MEVRHINRSSSATPQPKVDTSTNMLCLRPPPTYMLWSVCRSASHLRHLTASFDSFAEQGSDAGASQVAVGVMRLSRGGLVAIT